MYTSIYQPGSKDMNLTFSFPTNTKIQRTNVTLKDIIRKINSSVASQRSEETITTRAKISDKRRLPNSTAYSPSFLRHRRSIEQSKLTPHMKVKAFYSNVSSCSQMKPRIVNVPTHLLFSKSK